MKFLIVLILFVSSCEYVGTERKSSALQVEPAAITELSYVPAQHYSATTGFTSNGHLMFAEGSSSREVWAVIFTCYKHNASFALDNKELYEKVARHNFKDVRLWYTEEIEYYPKHPEKGEKVVDIETHRIEFPDGTVVEVMK